MELKNDKLQMVKLMIKIQKAVNKTTITRF